MTTDDGNGSLADLDVLVGRWTMTASFNSPSPPPLAETKATLLQHDFDLTYTKAADD